MHDDRADLTISRFIKAPPARVWEAWTQREHFERWWIPEPIECRAIKLDLRPGGGFETRMRQPGGDFEPHVAGCFLDIVPEERLVFSTALTEGWRPGTPWLALTAVITLAARDGGTLYAARVLHRTPEEARKHDDMGFHDGWGTALTQLARLVEARGEA